MKLRMKQIKLKNGKKNLSVYRANKYKYDFQQYKTIRSFVEVFILVKLIQMKLKWIKAIY